MEPEEKPQPKTPEAEDTVAPYDADELRAVFKRPHHILNIVMSEPGRLAGTIGAGRHLGLLLTILLGTSILAALPYGWVVEQNRFWNIVFLFSGSFAICFPSLLVFSAYIGCRINPVQNLALGLVITAVAAIFTFGFFPILWFLEATMLEDAAQVTPYHINLVLLIFSLVVGIGQLFRCFFRLPGGVGSSPLLMVCWLFLYSYITYRMALVLGLV